MENPVCSPPGSTTIIQAFRKWTSFWLAPERLDYLMPAIFSVVETVSKYSTVLPSEGTSPGRGTRSRANTRERPSVGEGSGYLTNARRRVRVHGEQYRGPHEAEQIYVNTRTVSAAASQRVSRAFEEAQIPWVRVGVSDRPQMVEKSN